MLEYYTITKSVESIELNYGALKLVTIFQKKNYYYYFFLLAATHFEWIPLPSVGGALYIC